MRQFKIAVFVGTRPEIIRLAEIIKKLKKHTSCFLIHTGQNYDYELNEIFFKDLEIDPPDYYLDAAGNNSSETIGNVIISADKILEKIKPEALLVLGDTNSCLAVIPAKRRKIPIFHMEAGNRCFDLRVPEEINRKIVDHTSDVNLTYSNIAREYLIREGVAHDLIIKVGSPMYEVINKFKKKIQNSTILKKLKLKRNRFFLMSFHREENIDFKKNLKKIVETLNLLAEEYNLPIIVSTHPRTKKRLDDYNTKFSEKIKFLKPFCFTDYIKLQVNSLVVISDSGTISEESSILQFDAINFRETHERPEAMEEASVPLVGMNKELILQTIKIILQQRKDNVKLNTPNEYKYPNVSDKVLRIILSYTDYVNRKIWNKS